MTNEKDLNLSFTKVNEKNKKYLNLSHYGFSMKGVSQ